MGARSLPRPLARDRHPFVIADPSARLSGTMIAAPTLMLSIPRIGTHSVMAGLVPAIHVSLRHRSQTWMTVTSTAMTAFVADASAHGGDCEWAITVPDSRDPFVENPAARRISTNR
jgi:hypothetical protein